jgi:PTS system fructose-specific IIC component
MALITEDQVVLDLTGADRHEATTLLAQQLVTSGRCTDIDTFLADVRERESKMATGLPGGIGIPHARSEAITEPSLVFGRSTDGIDWGAKDGPATLVFLIAAPAGGGDAHMQMLPKLARALMKKDFKAALAAATTEAEVVRIVEAEVSLDSAPQGTGAAEVAAATAASAPAATAAATSSDAASPPAAAAPAAAVVEDAPRSMNLVGVTSCPTGIAHTYMAAEVWRTPRRPRATR